MISDSPEFDVVIAGGGLVGGSLAIALAATGCSVALVEAVAPDSAEQPSFDDRTIALSRGSQRILDTLGIWPSLAASAWPIREIHVSEQRRFGTALITAEQQGIQELGFVIKSRELGLALWDRLLELPGITTFCPATVGEVGLASGYRSVGLDAPDSRSLRGRLLVVADGARSKVRDSLGVGAADREYDQVAVVANLQVDERHRGYRAFERFTAEGPVAVLPGRDGSYTLVLARTRAVAPAVMALPDAELLSLVQETFGFRLGRFTKIGRRVAYPLHLVTADAVTAPRAAIIGNAAHGLHPVAAQGFNLGLRDAATLAEILADGFAAEPENFDPGSDTVLTAYREWRERDQRKVVRFTDGLIRLFGLPGASVAVTRGLGLAAFDILPGAKQELARQTMGLTGRLTRLARGLRL